MLNKAGAVLVLLMFCGQVFSQKVILVRNNSLKKVTFHLPKKISADYLTDSGIVQITGRAVAWAFPFLKVTTKADTLALDVRKLQVIRFTASTAVIQYAGVFLMATWAAGLVGTAFSGAPVAIVYLPIPLFLAYRLMLGAHKKLDMHTGWSFK